METLGSSLVAGVMVAGMVIGCSWVHLLPPPAAGAGLTIRHMRTGEGGEEEEETGEQREPQT